MHVIIKATDPHEAVPNSAAMQGLVMVSSSIRHMRWARSGAVKEALDARKKALKAQPKTLPAKAPHAACDVPVASAQLLGGSASCMFSSRLLAGFAACCSDSRAGHGMIA